MEAPRSPMLPLLAVLGALWAGERGGETEAKSCGTQGLGAGDRARGIRTETGNDSPVLRRDPTEDMLAAQKHKTAFLETALKRDCGVSKEQKAEDARRPGGFFSDSM